MSVSFGTPYNLCHNRLKQNNDINVCAGSHTKESSDRHDLARDKAASVTKHTAPILWCKQ